MIHNKKISIKICDDHQAILLGLCSYLKDIDSIELLGSYNNPLILFESLNLQKPDMVISDLDMPQIDGMELFDLIRKDFPSIKIIICTMHINKWTMQKLVAKNIDGIISKNNLISSLVLGIETVSKGELFYSKDIKDVLTDIKKEHSKFEKIYLTKREKQVLNLIAKEYSTKDISEELFLSPNTINTHRKNLFLKFEVNNKVGLIKKAINKGMI